MKKGYYLVASFFTGGEPFKKRTENMVQLVYWLSTRLLYILGQNWCKRIWRLLRKRLQR